MNNSFKAIILGKFGVGKTSLLLKASKILREIPGSYKTTIGVDIVQIDMKYMGKSYNLKIWDTAGMERFANVINLFYPESEAIILVYDITDLESFHIAEAYLQDFISKTGRTPPTIIVGTKSDLADKVVTDDIVFKFTSKWGIKSIECSASTGLNIQKIFELLLEDLLQSNRHKYTGSFKVDEKYKPKGGCKC